MFIMVDVLIRNMDPKVWAQIKADAAAHERSLAQEVKDVFVRYKLKNGTGRDLLKLPTISIDTPEGRTASQNVDKLAAEGAYDEYMRRKRSGRFGQR